MKDAFLSVCIIVCGPTAYVELCAKFVPALNTWCPSGVCYRKCLSAVSIAANFKA